MTHFVLQVSDKIIDKQQITEISVSDQEIITDISNSLLTSFSEDVKGIFINILTQRVLNFDNNKDEVDGFVGWTKSLGMKPRHYLSFRTLVKNPFKKEVRKKEKEKKVNY